VFAHGASFACAAKACQAVRGSRVAARQIVIN
jgi:hypothetical protein